MAGCGEDKDEGNWVFIIREGGIWVRDSIPVHDSNDTIGLGFASMLLETAL
jgi:hypothetical protein